MIPDGSDEKPMRSSSDHLFCSSPVGALLLLHLLLLLCSPTFLSEGVSLIWLLCYPDPPLCKSCGGSKASHAVLSFPPPYRRTCLVVTSAVPCSPFPFCLYTPTHIIFLRWSHPLVCKSCPAVMITLILSICPFFYFHLKWSKIKIHLLLTSSDACLRCIGKQMTKRRKEALSKVIIIKKKIFCRWLSPHWGNTSAAPSEVAKFCSLSIKQMLLFSDNEASMDI